MFFRDNHREKLLKSLNIEIKMSIQKIIHK